MKSHNIPASRGRHVGFRHRCVRNLRCRIDALDLEFQLVLIKTGQLERLGKEMLQAITRLSAREAALGRAYPTGAERYQYIVDAATHEMGQALTDLTRRWQTSDHPGMTGNKVKAPSGEQGRG